MPGLPLGADFTNVLKKRHQEITVKEVKIPLNSATSPATSPTSEKIPTKPEKPTSDSKPEWLKNLAATKRKSAFIDDKVNVVTEPTKPLSPGDSDDEKNSPKIMPKKSVKDRMRNFQNLDTGKNDKIDDKNNSSSAIKNRFGKSVIKEKIPETVENKPSLIKRITSPPVANNINTSSSTANTSTDSTESNLSSKLTSKVVPENLTQKHQGATAPPLTGNLTLPQLSKLIQQQAQLISELQLENKNLNKRVDDLEKLIKR